MGPVTKQRSLCRMCRDSVDFSHGIRAIEKHMSVLDESISRGTQHHEIQRDLNVQLIKTTLAMLSFACLNAFHKWALVLDPWVTMDEACTHLFVLTLAIAFLAACHYLLTLGLQAWPLACRRRRFQRLQHLHQRLT